MWEIQKRLYACARTKDRSHAFAPLLLHAVGDATLGNSQWPSSLDLRFGRGVICRQQEGRTGRAGDDPRRYQCYSEPLTQRGPQQLANRYIIPPPTPPPTPLPPDRTGFASRSPENVYHYYYSA